VNANREAVNREAANLRDQFEMRRTQWAEPGVSAALCWLAIDDLKGNPRRQSSLPPSLYSDTIASFLHFDQPLPNQLYAVGGRNQQQGPLDTIEMFDTWHGKWVTCPSMAVRRAGCAAASLPDGRMIVIGGYDESGIVKGLLSSCEIFDPSTQTWTTSAPLQRARWGHGCACLGGLVYVVGGCSLRPGAPPHDAFMETLRGCEVYNPQTETWSTCSDLSMARAGSRVVTLGDRCLAAVGGCDDVFGRAEMLPTVELFDIEVGRWQLLNVQLTTPRTTAAVAAIDDRRILVIGGAPSLSSAEVYHVPEAGETDAAAQDPPQQQRVQQLKGPPVTDMVEGRTGCQAVALELPALDKTYPLCTRQCVLVVGGENGDDDWDYDHAHVWQFSTVLVYDVLSDKWEPEDSFPAMPTPRTAMALCVSPGKIGGHP